ncbi:MAG: rhodanese-like domain-containing protein [Oscillospiraceae bacterium]|nr:rhodanese-like domain-containing protein [Oscillospiraceae bacterium]
MAAIDPSADAPRMTQQEAHRIMGSSEPHVVLDVRTPAEYAEARIAGSILIPVDGLVGRAAAELPDKGAYILTYCRSGGRAGRAAKTLRAMGYGKAVNIGGINEWPYGTVKG